MANTTETAKLAKLDTARHTKALSLFASTMTRHLQHSLMKSLLVLSVTTTAILAAAMPARAAGETIGGCVLEKLNTSFEDGNYRSLEQMLTSTASKENGKSDDDKKGGTLEKKLEGCLEAPDTIIPALDEVIWGGLAFLVLLGFMQWKGFPAVKRAMDARSEKIRNDLDAADDAKTSAQRIQTEYEEKLKNAEEKAAAIIEEARAKASQLKLDLQAQAEAEIAEKRANASAEIDANRSQAIDDLRSEIATIAVDAAEQVVAASINPETHRQLIDDYIDQVSASGAANTARTNGSP
ncbi:MAG: F0F1 ATP synthase subunit B [Acidimicrobiaceae bacterium]|nr:F0F1 ATP synthase subunit B [Acidimicrobiaceae bacterium]